MCWSGEASAALATVGFHVRSWPFYGRLDPQAEKIPWFEENLREPCAESAAED